MDFGVRPSGIGNVICRADRRGGRCVSTQIFSDLDTRRSTKSDGL